MASPAIVGIGAVNLDYIIDSRGINSRTIGSRGLDSRSIDSHSIENGSDAEEAIAFAGFDYGSERSATAGEIEDALERLSGMHRYHEIYQQFQLERPTEPS